MSLEKFKEEVNINFLRIPLYKLNYIKEISEFNGLNPEEIKSLSTDYSIKETKSICTALNWATKNPSFDFKSFALLEKNYSNQEIYQFLCKMNESIKCLQG